MINEMDCVKISGSFVTQSQHDHSSLLTAGVLEVGGDFTQINYITSNNFKASGNHKVILNGDELQTVKFGAPSSANSCFNTLELKNSSTEGVNLETKVVVIKELKQTQTPVTGVISLA